MFTEWIATYTEHEKCRNLQNQIINFCFSKYSVNLCRTTSATSETSCSRRFDFICIEIITIPSLNFGKKTTWVFHKSIELFSLTRIVFKCSLLVQEKEKNWQIVTIFHSGCSSSINKYIIYLEVLRTWAWQSSIYLRSACGIFFSSSHFWHQCFINIHYRICSRFHN